jgi:hypothetical protein
VREESGFFLHEKVFYAETKVEAVRGDQEGLFKLIMLNFIFKWYNTMVN